MTTVDAYRWERRSCGEGAKGQRFYDWVCLTVRVKDEDARTRVAAWIDEYNRERRHSALGMRSPVTFELRYTRSEQARRAA